MHTSTHTDTHAHTHTHTHTQTHTNPTFKNVLQQTYRYLPDSVSDCQLAVKGFQLREEIQAAVDYSGGEAGSGSNATVTLSLREALHTFPGETITINPPPAAVYRKLPFLLFWQWTQKLFTMHALPYL